MPVVFTVPALSIEASGPTYSVRRLCEAVRTVGVDARVAALDWSPMNGVPEYAKLFPLGFGPRRLGRSPAMARRLFEQVHSGGVEILHNHGLWMLPNAYPAPAGASIALWLCAAICYRLIFMVEGLFICQAPAVLSHWLGLIALVLVSVAVRKTLRRRS